MTLTASSALSSSSPGLPSYKRPPVSEVAVGLFFEPIHGFLLPHTGLFWAVVKGDFPVAEHAPTLMQPGVPIAWKDGTGFPLPRIWLKSEDNRNLLQLQGNCFFYNWRRISDEDEYPRYPAIIDRFERNLYSFLAQLREIGLSEPKPLSCELAYINHIPQGMGWNSPDDIRQILRDFCWSSDAGRFFRTPTSLSWSSTFPLPEGNGQLTTNLSQVRRLTEQPPSLQLELTARGLGKARNVWETRPWFDLAREHIVRGFADLTTPDAQKTLWGREDV